ncbi:MAG: hypothetical protein SGPRY_008542 [Prymnesium sp.]
MGEVSFMAFFSSRAPVFGYRSDACGTRWRSRRVTVSGISLHFLLSSRQVNLKDFDAHSQTLARRTDQRDSRSVLPGSSCSPRPRESCRATPASFRLRMGSSAPISSRTPCHSDCFSTTPVPVVARRMISSSSLDEIAVGHMKPEAYYLEGVKVSVCRIPPFLTSGLNWGCVCAQPAVLVLEFPNRDLIDALFTANLGLGLQLSTLRIALAHSEIFVGDGVQRCKITELGSSFCLLLMLRHHGQGRWLAAGWEILWRTLVRVET